MPTYSETTIGGITLNGTAVYEQVYPAFIGQNDIELSYSGGSSNSNPNGSLGGSPSSFQITDNINNLFDLALFDKEITTEDIDYRSFFVFNQNRRFALKNVKVWMDVENTLCELFMGIGDVVSSPTATYIRYENNAPNGVAFNQPIDENSAYTFASIPPGYGFWVWIKRIIPSGQSVSTDIDGFIFHMTGDDDNEDFT